MTEVTAKRRIGTSLFTVAASALAALAVASPAAGRPYTVVSCDAAGLFGHSSSAWAPFGNAGRSYSTCPSGSGDVAGISNRLVGATYGGFGHAGHAFTAPPGTTITSVRWAGRMARDNCDWGTYLRALPSGDAVLGTPPGQFCPTSEWDTRGWPMSFPVPAGTTRLEQLVVCGAAQCSPGATLHSQYLEVTLDDPVPPSISLSGPLASGQWVSGTAGRFPEVGISASDNTGVQRVDVALGRRTLNNPAFCDYSRSTPCATDMNLASTPAVSDLPDGPHRLGVSAVDAAGNAATVDRDVYIDNTPPDPVVPEVDGGGVWRRSNGFRVRWQVPPQSAAPVSGAHWKLCDSAGRCSSRGSRYAKSISELPNVLVPAPGEYRFHVWLEDAAANQREAHGAVAVPLRFDPEPPELAFGPGDPGDPLRVVVAATDPHSGIAGGEIEMRARGGSTWHELETSYEEGQLVAYVDDERFRTGAFEFRAHARDHAGNQASTATRADGSAAVLRLPARVITRLRVGARPERSTNRRLGRRPRLDNDVAARLGRQVRLAGRLTNVDGHPLEAATIDAYERTPDGTLIAIGFATTRRDGWFEYTVRARQNRHFVFRYGGSRRVGSTTATFRLRVPALSSISVDRRQVRNGQAVQFSGRVESRPVPPSGKLIEMQAHFRGRWRTFSTVRSDLAGRWRFMYRFGATLGRVVYRFRAALPPEGGYPFTGGRSRVQKVVVEG